MTQRDSNRITQRDKTCPVAVHRGRDKPFKGLSCPDATGGKKACCENRNRTKLPFPAFHHWKKLRTENETIELSLPHFPPSVYGP